nr:hypothetical protein [Streptomyces sp. TLI_235]
MDPNHLALIEEVRRIAPENVKVEFSGEVIIMQAAPSAIHQRNLDHGATVRQLHPFGMLRKPEQRPGIPTGPQVPYP